MPDGASASHDQWGSSRRIPELEINGGIPADHCASRNIVRNAGLGGSDHAIANLAVACDSDLPGQNYVLSNLRRAGQTSLGAEQGIFTYPGAMSNLDKIVDFRALRNVGFPDAGAVHAGVGLHFDVIFEDRRARLHDLVPVTGVIFGKSEAIGANDHAVLQDDMIAESAMLAHNCVGVSKEMVADARAWINHDVGQQGSIGSNDNVAIDHNVRPDMRVRPDARARVNDGCGMYARCVPRGLVEQFDCARKRKVRIT